METINTQELIGSIRENLERYYKGVACVTKKDPEFYGRVLEVLAKPYNMYAIDMANNLGVPPLRTFLEIWAKTEGVPENTVYDENYARMLGAVFAYIYCKYFGYTGKAARRVVHRFGCGTGSAYFAISDSGQPYTVGHYFE